MAERATYAQTAEAVSRIRRLMTRHNILTKTLAHHAGFAENSMFQLLLHRSNWTKPTMEAVEVGLQACLAIRYEELAVEIGELRQELMV